MQTLEKQPTKGETGAMQIQEETRTLASISRVTTHFSIIFIPLIVLVLIPLLYSYYSIQNIQTKHLKLPRQLFVLDPKEREHTEGQAFQDLYPDAWDYIAEQQTGHYTAPYGIFTFDTHVLHSLPANRSLKIVSFTPVTALHTETRKILFRFSALASILLVVLVIGVWNMARSQINQERTIAELRVAHDGLKEKNANLAHLNASKDKFFSILAQDLQTPLTRALELVRFTSKNLDFFGKDEYKETTETLLSSLENLQELLKNLFTWSGIQRDTLTPHLQTVDLGSIVKRNTSILLPVAEDKQIIFKNSVPEKTFIYADPNMVYAIVRNLISNALKFSFPDDSVVISSIQHEHEIELVVKDSGVGIEGKNIPKLFRDDVTYQTPGTLGEEGAGLGLLLCKKLIEENGGSIRIESETGQGTTVTCRFPRKTI